MLNKKRILVVFGTRPEAIKLISVIDELRNNPDKFETSICITGQHREMLKPLLDLFNILPDYNLDIMKPNQDLFDISINVLSGMKDVIKESKPDLILVQGDTTTGMIVSLAAFYYKIPVGHIEAGLRTYDKYSPWPEEINRRIIDNIAQFYFAPTKDAKNKLLKENVNPDQITITGNTGIDVLNRVSNKFEHKSDNNHKRKILVTIHRRENEVKELEAICRPLIFLAEKYKDCEFVIPLHMNPHVRQHLIKLADNKHGNILLTEPIEYLQFVKLMNESYLIMTDSGGIQEEAPILGIPVLILRNCTERMEAVELGTARIVGANSELIISEFSKLMDDEKHYGKMSIKHNTYGDGKAAKRIVKTLLDADV